METYGEQQKRERIMDLLEGLEDQVDVAWVPLIHAAVKTYAELHEAHQKGYRVCLVDSEGKIVSDVAVPSDAGLIDRFIA